LAKRIRDLRQISEKNCRVQLKSAQRLKRDFKRQFGCVAECDHPARLGAHDVIFGQIADSNTLRTTLK
jgi:hypothetical protein